MAITAASKTPITKRNSDFDLWMADVDLHIAARIGGFKHDDLPDWGYADAYDEGMSSLMASRHAIQAAKESCGL